MKSDKIAQLRPEENFNPWTSPRECHIPCLRSPLGRFPRLLVVVGVERSKVSGPRLSRTFAGHRIRRRPSDREPRIKRRGQHTKPVHTARVIVLSAHFTQHRLEGAEPEQRSQGRPASQGGATANPLHRRLHLEGVAQLAG